ncbi:hypothetical protein DFH09DRAFT_1462051 [Mycena vulgaris]|nr:hypothetical protein DFH09DRAFT_1462051 [Mycena vulgaris]
MDAEKAGNISRSECRYPSVRLNWRAHPLVLVADTGDEAAAAKVWAVYIAEAEKYDKGLVESWRSDMEGMLIFAGLFSASLTAFLIESYETLNPDSGDITVRLLVQISEQLSASANCNTFNVPPAPSFAPCAASLLCNALWFTSLGLSLTCALIATLVEQWARDFLHRSEIHSAPLIRARIFSFLYYGLKRFSVHTVVEVIPLLLHAALIFFLAGLIVFLVPVHFAMAGLAAVILVVVSAVYCILTLLPLRYPDCPYRTPLSGLCWRALRRLTGRVDEAETMAASISRRATEYSEERTARDGRALIWTVKSLSNELELEPFVEAIPDVLWGPNYPRNAYSDHFRAMVHNPEVQLTARIKGLLDSCDTGLLSLEARKRRQIACCKAMWATASLFGSPSSPAQPTYRFDFPIWLGPTTQEDPEIAIMRSPLGP